MAASSEPCTATGCHLQIGNGLDATSCLQLLHDQIRLHPQQKRLTGVGAAGGRPSLQHLRLEQCPFAKLVVTGFQAALRPNLKSRQSGSLKRRCRQADSKQDCDGAREQGSVGRFTEMMTQFCSNTPPCTPTGLPLPCCCSLRCPC